MCIFLILVSPNDTTREQARAIANPLGVLLGNADLAWLRKQLPVNAAPAYATRGMCDCGTRLGCKSHGDDDDQDDGDPEQRFERNLQKRLARVRKEGWSDTKIRRWEQQQRQSRAHHERGRAWEKSNTLSLDEWRSFLRELLSIPNVSEVSLIIHMFEGSRDAGPGDVLGREHHRLPHLTDEALMALRWDVVHRIAR